MNYYSQNYYALHFLITPNELESLLCPYHLVIVNAHVPADYIESPISEYIELYKQLYEILISGDKLSSNKERRLFAQRCIVPNLLKCRYEKNHKYKGKEYKHIRFDDPHTCFSPFAKKIRMFV